MNIRDNAEKRRFEVEVEGHTAYAEYRKVADHLSFTHTMVPEALGGRGIGTALVKAGLAAARERGLKVKPICPFFKSYIDKHPEEQDLLA